MQCGELVIARTHGILILVWGTAFVFSHVHHGGRKRILPFGLILVAFYPMLPFTGFRSGAALGLVGFLLGAGPADTFPGTRL